ncbi:MAG: hypothetical protein ACRBDL_07795 [Alphaproteobacteria bacterium]
MDNSQPALTLDSYVECLARGHAFNKHVLGYDHKQGMIGINAFRAEETKAFYDTGEQKFVPPKPLGKDLFIETPDDLAHYIKSNFLTSDQTHGYVDPRDNSVNLYNPRDNVALHFSWKNSEGDLGTIYRYEKTAQNFDFAQKRAKKAATLMGVELQTVHNAQDPQASIDAVQDLIADINANPQNYLFKANNPESTIQNRVLDNAARPGRDWESDEVIRPSNNIKGHSKIYSEKNKLDVAPSDYVCSKQANADELNIGRILKSLRSGRVVRSIQNYGLDSTPEPEPELV